MNVKRGVLARACAHVALCVLPVAMWGQEPAAQEAPKPQGQVIFDSSQRAAAQQDANKAEREPAENATADIDDAARAAITVTAYDLDARLQPAAAKLSVRARMTLRNDGRVALMHVALQVSSALSWESVTLERGAERVRLPVSQHVVETDADHTGKASEAVLTLSEALAPGASMAVDAFYSGAITTSAARLERLGASASIAAQADWDAIGDQSTALRGFGNVLWYPVSSPQVFLGQGAQLFDAVGQMKLREAAAKVHLRLTLEYVGAPPVAAYFCGRRMGLKAISENDAMAAATAPGLTAADFAEQKLGFRSMSLFVVSQRETPADPQPEGWSLLSVETEDEAPLPVVAATAQDAAGLLADWLGPQPLSSLTLIDHPGQPFEDGPMLVAPLAALAAEDGPAAIVHSMTHAWVQSGQPWMDEGLAEFFVLLWTERTHGRDTAIEQMHGLVQPLTLAEIAPEAGKPAAEGQPLIATANEVYFRRKAAAVWWMLRDIAGEKNLRVALSAWRLGAGAQRGAAESAAAFEALLEKTSGKDLKWFFDDWVLHDRGLPDLSIVDVTPRELSTSTGKPGGWLTSVTLHNDGATAAEIPVVVRSGSFSETQRLRVPAFGNATARVLVEAPPTQIVVNDGSVPEQRVSLHTRDVNVRVQ